MNNTKPLTILLIVSLISLLVVGVIGISSFKESLIEAKKEDVKKILNMARNQSTIYINQHKQGVLTKEQAEKKVVALLSAMQHKSDYVWANDSFGIARVHARKEIVGQFQKSYVEHMAQLTDHDFFYLTQPNIKPIKDERVLKINGITKLPEWDWVIGFGIYLDDVDRVVFDAEMQFIISIIASILLVSVVALYWIRQLKTP